MSRIQANLDFGGSTVGGQRVNVYLHGTQTPATIYDRDGTTALPNPLTLTPNGHAVFQADAGTYDLVGVDRTRTVVLAVSPATYAPVAATALPSYVTNQPRTNAYRPDRSIYNLKASNTRRLRRSLAKAKKGGGYAHLTAAGHSIVAGYGATTPTSWATQVRDLLVSAGYVLGGTGVAYAYTGATDARWSFTGTVSNSGMFKTLSSGATATFASDVAGTNADIHSFGNSGGFSITVDGGTPANGNVTVSGGTYNAGAVTPGGAQSSLVVSVSGLSNATHTIVITASANNCYVLGANVYGSGGLIFTSGGMSGSTTSQWTGTGFASLQKQVQIGMGGGGTDAYIVELLTNDASAAVSLATYTSNLTTLVQSLQATGDVILVTDPQQNAVAQATHEGYVSAMYDVADTCDVPLIDVYDRFGNYTTANGGGIMYDTIHPNTAGHSDIARAVFGAIT